MTVQLADWLARLTHFKVQSLTLLKYKGIKVKAVPSAVVISRSGNGPNGRTEINRVEGLCMTPSYSTIPLHVSCLWSATGALQTDGDDHEKLAVVGGYRI